MLEITGKAKDFDVIGNHDQLKGKLVIHASGCRVQLPKGSGTIDAQIHDPNVEIDLSGVRRFDRILLNSKNGGNVRIGRDSTIETANILADGADVILGQDCMISFNVNLRTSDGHGIYDLTTGDRANYPGDVVLADHVWVGQGAVLSRNTSIGKCCVIGAFSFLSNCVCEPHSIYAGTPARKIRDNVMWERKQSDNIYAEGADLDPYFRANMAALRERP